MGCMADYDEDCKGEKPEGCMCFNCCKNATPEDIAYTCRELDKHAEEFENGK